MEIAATFGQWLKQRRHELDLTQEAVAEATGCSPDTIRKIEAGHRRPSRQIADILADFLHIEAQQRAAFVLWARGISNASPAVAVATEEPPAVSSETKSSPLTFVPRPAPTLPIMPTTLVGRERDLEHAKTLLWRSTTRLLTLLGPPGIGKTSLGIALASALQADFKDGLVYVPLGPVSDPTLVAATVAEGLGVRETPAQPLLYSLQEALRDKQLLLVLDNFEHVTRAAPLLTELLASAPLLKILVTSRSALHLRGEKLMEVPPLDIPDPERLPPIEELKQIGSVALFAERVRDARDDFEITQENASVVAAICAQLDGLPLGIELAAAKTRMLSLPALHSRLEKQLSLLTDGPLDAPLHQQTLRSSLLSSYQFYPSASYQP